VDDDRVAASFSFSKPDSYPGSFLGLADVGRMQGFKITKLVGNVA
jgi:hypothetical protein